MKKCKHCNKSFFGSHFCESVRKNLDFSDLVEDVVSFTSFGSSDDSYSSSSDGDCGSSDSGGDCGGGD